MLCPHCHRQLDAGRSACPSCGKAIAGRSSAFELLAPDGARIPLSRSLTLGRGSENDVTLSDPSVSRRHARVRLADGVPMLEDAGSSHGTFLNGRRIESESELRAGSLIQLGDIPLRVVPADDTGAAGRTLVVPAGSSFAALQVPVDAAASGEISLRPRVRSGWALKRLEVEEGAERYVLRDLRGGSFVRLSEAEAELFRLLDGQHTVPALVALAEERFGSAGPATLARLLADLAERGLLHGSESAAARDPEEPRPGLFRRLVRPRVWASESFGGFVERLYARGAWVLFLRPVVIALVALGVAGVAAFSYLVARRYGTPFVVASHIGVGAVVFVTGRLALVTLHELAHGLACASYGRRVARAGIKLVLVFPYAFVDTSEAWFEPRRRRIAISAAGPISDFAVGGAFALASLLSGRGALRDIEFQVALGGYLAALFNLSPMLDRDGYHILIDLARQPNLRARARAWLAARISGRQADGARALVIFSAATILWSIVTALFALAMTLRYYDVMLHFAPRELVWGLLGSFFMVLLIPLFVMIGTPLLHRRTEAPVVEE
ncbi:MAG: putative peptide zinc metalloprotease protein [Gaiellales bacterium]|nr:putative peptide zinc metalloprotease protein [Gaiellales bacterium]